MTSTLESVYYHPTRPYSQNELNQMRVSLHTNIKLGKKMANHQRCVHIYLTKNNGRKEKAATVDLIRKNNILYFK